MHWTGDRPAAGKRSGTAAVRGSDDDTAKRKGARNRSQGFFMVVRWLASGDAGRWWMNWVDNNPRTGRVWTVKQSKRWLKMPTGTELFQLPTTARPWSPGLDACDSVGAVATSKWHAWTATLITSSGSSLAAACSAVRIDYRGIRTP